MNSIPPKLLQELRMALLACGPFDDISSLRSAFLDSRIAPWRNSLPVASNQAEQVNKTIDFLAARFNANNENALVLFLSVLAETVNPNDKCHQDLLRIANRLQEELNASKSKHLFGSLEEKRSDYNFLSPTKLALVAILSILALAIVFALVSKDPNPSPTLSDMSGDSVTDLPIISPTLSFEPKMIPIPAGEFIMGSDPEIDQWASDDEQPQHKVYLSDYYIAETAITNSQYATFVKLANHTAPVTLVWENDNYPSGMDDHPVSGVSWEDAIAYTKWLSDVSGNDYRLPTEAEWEKACRGIEGYIFPWGNDWDPQRVTNFEALDGNSLRGTGTTSVYEHVPVGNSPFDVVDMTGNIWEWTSDWYNEQEYARHVDPSTNSYSYFEDSIVRNPYGYPAGRSKVLKGGSALDNRGIARCAARGRNNTTIRIEGFGFRVALSP